MSFTKSIATVALGALGAAIYSAVRDRRGRAAQVDAEVLNWEGEGGGVPRGHGSNNPVADETPPPLGLEAKPASANTSGKSGLHNAPTTPNGTSAGGLATPTRSSS